MSIKEQAKSTVIWSSIERFSVQGIQFILMILLGKLLAPDIFAPVAMLNIFMAVAQTFIDSGFANALIQRKERQEKDYSTVFYFNIAISLPIYFLLYFCAPLIANFYEMPLLVDLTRVLGLILIINSLGIVQQAKLTIELDFRRQAYATLLAVVVSGILGVWMAYTGWGVWALVWQALTNNLLRVIFLWIFAHWAPRLEFSMQSFRELFNFGSKLLASTMLHTLYQNVPTLIIGKFYSATELGCYNQAFRIAQLPSVNITNVIVRAVYPIQCRLQDDMEQLRDLFLKYMRMACYIIFPIMIALAAVAYPLVEVLLSEKWLPAVPMLQLLAIAYMWDPVMRINHNMLNVKGRTDYFLYAELIKKTVAFSLLIASVPFGVKMICAGLIVYSFADIAIIVYYSRKLTGITLYQQFRSLVPIMLLSFSMGGIMYAITLIPNISSVIHLLISLLLGTAWFFIGSWIFRFKEFAMLLSLVKRNKTIK